MAPPYSTDLHWRIVWAILTLNISPDEASKLFNVSSHTDTRYVNLFQETGYVVPAQCRYGPYPLMGSYEQIVLLRLIMEYPGIYVSEIQVKLFEMFGVDVSAPTICRTLKAMGCSRQKIQNNVQRNAELGIWQRSPCTILRCLVGLTRLRVIDETAREGTDTV